MTDVRSESPPESEAAGGGPVVDMLETPAAPRRPMGTKGKVAATALVVALLAGGGVAMAESLGHKASAVSTTTAGGAPGGFGGTSGSGGTGRPSGGGGGGGGAPATGTISAVSASSISVKASSGTVTTYTVSSSTGVQNNGATSTVGQLSAGEKVVVFTGAMPGASTSSSTTSTTAASQILAGTSATQSRGSGGTAGAGGAPPNGTGSVSST